MKAQQEQRILAEQNRRAKLIYEAEGVVILDEAWLMFRGKSHPTFNLVANADDTKHTLYLGTTGYGKSSDISLEDRKPIVVELDS